MGEEGEEPEKDYGQKETENPNVMDANRRCRDILCLVLFLVAWVGWIIVAAMAFTDGCPDNCNDPSKLIFGFDSDGCMCGKDCTTDLGVDNTDKKRLYIPDPREASQRICVASCPPSFAFDKALALQHGTYRCGAACLAASPHANNTPAEFFLERERGGALSGYGVLDNCFLSGSRETDCWFPSYPSADVFYKCVPALPGDLSAEDTSRMQALGLPVGNAAFGDALAVMSNPAGEFGKLTGELASSWVLLVASVFIAVALGFVFLILLRLFAVPMMWFTVIGLVVVLGLATLFAWDKTGKVAVFAQLSDATGQNITALADAAGGSAGFDGSTEPALVEAAAWILTIVTVVYVVVLFFFLKRIVIAVKVIVEAAKAMAAVPTMILQPLWTFLSLVVLYVWAGSITIYLVSAGEFDPATGTFTYAGGTCKSDLANTSLSVSHSAAAVSLSLAAGVILNASHISTDNGATWASTGTGLVRLSGASLQGTSCAFDSTLLTDRCSGNTNTSSAANLITGGCFGGASCGFTSDGGPWLHQATAGLAASSGEVSWNATEGAVAWYVAAGATVNGSNGEAIRFALNVHRCGTEFAEACGAWALSSDTTPPTVTVTIGGASVAGVGATLVTTNITSAWTVSEGEALRACNLYGDKATAQAKLISAKQVQLERQGKGDVRELRATAWATKPTVDNWKGFLPVTLDGETYNYFVLFHLFMFLWTNDFTVSSGYYIICGTVAAWYWSLDKKDLPRGMVAKSTYRYVRYNLGTVCFGSFIIAVVQMIRILFNYFVSKSKQFKDNPVVKALVCVVNCCLWCLEKVIGYINKNAYIMSATHGYGFCTGAWKGFMLLMRNLLRVAAVNVVAVAILFFGKVFIALSTLIVSYLIATTYANDLNLQDGPPFLSLFIILLMAWFVASSFMGTYGAAVDTIFLSFLHDQEVNDGSPGKPYYMADSLRASIGVKNAKVTPAGDTDTPQDRDSAN